MAFGQLDHGRIVLDATGELGGAGHHQQLLVAMPKRNVAISETEEPRTAGDYWVPGMPLLD